MLARQEGYARRGDDPGVKHSAPSRPGHPPEHVKSTRWTRVYPCLKPRAPADKVLENRPQSAADLADGGRVQGIFPRHSTDAVRAKKLRFACHIHSHCILRGAVQIGFDHADNQDDKLARGSQWFPDGAGRNDATAAALAPTTRRRWRPLQGRAPYPWRQRLAGERLGIRGKDLLRRQRT